MASFGAHSVMLTPKLIVVGSKPLLLNLICMVMDHSRQHYK